LTYQIASRANRNLTTFHLNFALDLCCSYNSDVRRLAVGAVVAAMHMMNARELLFFVTARELCCLRGDGCADRASCEGEQRCFEKINKRLVQ
jgi:hypothetical protein